MRYPTSVSIPLIVLLLLALCYSSFIATPLSANDDPPVKDDGIISFDSAYVVYRVHDGDFLSKISREFGIPMTEIMNANDIDPKDAKIYIGQDLKIPTRGRTNEVLNARRKRVMYDSDNELALMEKDLGSLEFRLNHLKFEMDSLQFAIKQLEKKELIGENSDFDENDMNALLRQMEKAKEIGQKKQALDKYLKEREFEFLAKNQEAKQLNNEISDLKNNLENKNRDVNAKNQSQMDEIPALEAADSPIDTPNIDQGASGQQLNAGDDVIEEQIDQDKSELEADAALDERQIEAAIEQLEANAARDEKQMEIDEKQAITDHPEKVEIKKEILEYEEPENYETSVLPDPSPPLKKEQVAQVPKSKKKQVKFKGYKDKEKPSSKKLKEKASKKKGKKSGPDRSYMHEKGDRKAFKGLEDVDVEAEMDSINRIKAEFFLGRALTEIERRQYKKAEKFVDKSLRLSPDYLDARILQGDINATFGFDEKAIKHYDYALKLDSATPQIYYNRAHCLLTLEKNERAYSDFTKALEIDDKYILAYAGRASISVDINDFDAAISDYTRIIKLNRHFIPAYKGRGVAYMELGDYDRAMQDFNFILELAPNEPAIYYKRGLLKVLTDQLYDACFDLWTAAEMGYRDANKAIKKYCN